MSYRGLWRSELLVWLCVVVASRLPVAMAPLAFVFLARESTGDYALGALLAAVYTTAEALGAPLLGSRLRTRRLRPEIAVGLLISAAASGGIAAFSHASAAFLGGLAAVAGACSAAAPGALRAMVTTVVHEDHVPSALSVEASVTMAVWAVSPALVSVTALTASAAVPFVIGSASTLLAVGALWILPHPPAARAAATPPRQAARDLASAWPVYVTSAAMMYLLATVELTLPALLEQRGHPVSHSGPLLTSCAVASVLGGIVYGSRSWPGGPDQHSVLLLTLAGFVTTALAGASHIVLLLLFLLLLGFSQAIVLISRSLSLRRLLTDDLHPAGYSLLYAGSGVGYGVSAAATGLVLAHHTPSVAVLIAAGVTVLGTAATVPWGVRAGRRRAGD